jgi:hypothetical protein
MIVPGALQVMQALAESAEQAGVSPDLLALVHLREPEQWRQCLVAS